MGPWISETLVTVMRLTLVLFRTKFNQNELRISGGFSGTHRGIIVGLTLTSFFLEDINLSTQW